MNRIIVAGIGTGVGKTVVSAILMTLFQADYWKPIQCGDAEDLDSRVIERLIQSKKHRIFPSAYTFNGPLSPHHASRLENISIDTKTLIPPQTSRTLVIESVGGVLVPLTSTCVSLDVFKTWSCQWVVVSRHYLGSINHTLLTIEALKTRGISLNGVIFNGESNVDTEEAILQITQLPMLGRLSEEVHLSYHTIQEYAKRWKPQFQHLFL